MGYPAFKSNTSNFTSSGTSLTPVEVSGWANDDIVLSAAVVGVGGGAITGPTGGWTTLASVDGTNSRFRVWGIRRRNAALSLGISWGVAAYGEYSVSAFSGCDSGATLYDVLAVNGAAQRNPTNPDCPSITTTVPETLVVAIGMGWSGAASSWGPPTGYTMASGVTPTLLDLCSAYKRLATATTENPAAFTGSAAGGLDDVGEFTIALKGPQVVASAAEPGRIKVPRRRRWGGASMGFDIREWW